MRIARTPSEIRRQLKSLRASKSVAFVPTMGCLHAGHLSLIRRAKALADIVVVSIYVNPLQFGPNEDLDSYPRTFDADAKLCAEAGVDFLFNPTTLYPKSGPKITLKADSIPDCLCGRSRPGHFDGVITVVNILFNIVQPDIALFGEKDWQQLTLIRRMTLDLHMAVEVDGGETVREADGLALSSRNRYLTTADRSRAVAISRALYTMQQLARAGECDIEALKHAAIAILTDAGITAEYLDIRNPDSLKRKVTLNNRPARAFIAARVGHARLIDNMPLHQTEDF